MESIAHLERLKTYTIASRDLDQLADLTHREEERALVVRDLEQSRQTLVQAYCSPDEIEPTVEELASRLESEDAAALRAASDELRTTIADLRQLTNLNGALLQWAAELAHATGQWLLGYG